MLPDLGFFDEIADAAARETLPRFRAAGSIDNKWASGFDPVTEADREAERVIRALITARYPEHGILGEEYGDVGLDRDHVWVIDPIDGTRAFISGLPVWGTLVGLYHHGRAVMSMMDQPFTGERFVAGPDGAFLSHNGERHPLRTRTGRTLAQATLMTTSPFLYAGSTERPYRALENAVQLTRYGCDCYAFAMVAAGHIDLCVDSGLKPYDVGGLIALVEQAGGVFTDWQGGRAEFGGNVIAAATPELHAAALEILNPPA